MMEPRLVEAVGTLIASHSRPGHVPLIAVAGSQGSGKTTLARAAATAFNAVQMSLDDVYLTRDERATVALTVHPLFETRGPPGTHDLALLHRVIDTVSDAGPDSVIPLPTFDKRADDRRPEADWRQWRGRPEAILLDGWCLGATAQDEVALIEPVNALERDQDPERVWRTAVNRQLAGDYAALAARCDAVVFLQAPGFDRVLDWRCEQEAGLLGVPVADLPSAERLRLAGFIQYFERVTRHMLAGGVQADVMVPLDQNRRPGLIGP